MTVSQNTNLIPWNLENSWQEANASIADHIERVLGSNDSVFHLARQIKTQYECLFPPMDDLCANTCPGCPDPCCSRAKIWFDFKDLIFLHLNRLPVPPAQPVNNWQAVCRYLGSHGCTLQRLSRPWICTWYLCPSQTSSLDGSRNSGRGNVKDALQQVKKNRNELERKFINIILPHREKSFAA